MINDNELHKVMIVAITNFNNMSEKLELDKLPETEHFVVRELFELYKVYVEKEYYNIIQHVKQNTEDEEIYTDYELFLMNEVYYDEKHFKNFIDELNISINKHLEYLKRINFTSNPTYNDYRYQKNVINKIIKKLGRLYPAEEDNEFYRK